MSAQLNELLSLRFRSPGQHVHDVVFESTSTPRILYEFYYVDGIVDRRPMGNVFGRVSRRRRIRETGAVRRFALQRTDEEYKHARLYKQHVNNNVVRFT